MTTIQEDFVLEVYPDMEFGDYLMTKLGADYFVRRNNLYLAIPRRKWYQISPPKLIAKLNTFYEEGVSDIEFKYNRRIIVNLIDFEHLVVIKDICDAYEADFNVKKVTLGEGYNRVVGKVECVIKMEVRDSTLGNSRKYKS